LRLSHPRTPHIPVGETVVVLPPEQADLFEYAGDIWADSVEDALGMLAKGVPGYWLERPIATGDVVLVIPVGRLAPPSRGAASRWHVPSAGKGFESVQPVPDCPDRSGPALTGS
jgi:hypothetical protein